MQEISFVKMHGLGNDFVVLDGRRVAVPQSDAHMRAIADRRSGVGCDQVILLETPHDTTADVFMRIRNADGSEVGACGNATRCVASVLMEERGTSHAIIETMEGLLDCERRPDGRIAVDMGPARLDWRDIPLAEEVDTNHLPVEKGPLTDPVGVGMGNPHCVFFTDDAETVDVARHGPVVEHHPLFPQRTNVEVVQVLAPDRLRMRVWERGTGVTRSCGTGACAALVAAARRGLSERAAEVVLDGGSLHIEWKDDNRVMMTGPVAIAFSGVLHPSLLVV